MRIGLVVWTRHAPPAREQIGRRGCSLIVDHVVPISGTCRLRLCRLIGHGHDAGTWVTPDVRAPSSWLSWPFAFLAVLAGGCLLHPIVGGRAGALPMVETALTNRQQATRPVQIGPTFGAEGTGVYVFTDEWSRELALADLLKVYAFLRSVLMPSRGQPTRSRRIGRPSADLNRACEALAGAPG